MKRCNVWRSFAAAWLVFGCLLLAAGCQNDPTVAHSAPKADAQTAANKARNVILFVGDGMGVATVTAARIFEGQMLGMDGEEHYLSFEKFPQLALVKTYNTDMQVPDSAGTMTALVTGYKTRAGVLSIGPDAARGDCAAALRHSKPTLLQMAEDRGLSTGIVSTARITHATPAATYAHSADRNWEADTTLPAAAAAAGCKDIARQLVEFDHGDGIDVILGGGRGAFSPKSAKDPETGEPGFRSDERALIDEWLGVGSRRYVWNDDGFRALSSKTDDQMLGLFESSHMQWEADRAKQPNEPSLEAMTRFAIERLSRNEKGYFLMVEAGRIDHAHHAGNAARALWDTVAYAKAVAAAVAATGDDTLIVVTADHSHTLTISGYPGRGNPILGTVIDPLGKPMKDANGEPYTTLGYANGPGFRAAGETLVDVDTTDLDFLQPAGTPMQVETHAGEDVPAYATGPGAHRVRGVMDQNELFDVMHAALFVGDVGGDR